jgi:hypothetical protein
MSKKEFIIAVAACHPDAEGAEAGGDPANDPAPVFTPWFRANRPPAREGWYEVRTADGGRLMADWRTIGGESAFWIYAEFGANPMRKKIADVRIWRGRLAAQDKNAPRRKQRGEEAPPATTDDTRAGDS